MHLTLPCSLIIVNLTVSGLFVGSGFMLVFAIVSSFCRVCKVVLATQISTDSTGRPRFKRFKLPARTRLTQNLTIIMALRLAQLKDAGNTLFIKERHRRCHREVRPSYPMVSGRRVRCSMLTVLRVCKNWTDTPSLSYLLYAKGVERHSFVVSSVNKYRKA